MNGAMVSFAGVEPPVRARNGRTEAEKPRIHRMITNGKSASIAFLRVAAITRGASGNIAAEGRVRSVSFGCYPGTHFIGRSR